MTVTSNNGVSLGAQPTNRPMPEPVSPSMHSSEQVAYALRALVRHGELTAALRIGEQGGDTLLPQALLDLGCSMHAMLWDASYRCHQTHGRLDDRELLHLTAIELAQEDAYRDIDPVELRAAIGSIFAGEAPDLAAGRQVIADVIEYYLGDEVEAVAYEERGTRGLEHLRAVQAEVQQLRQQVEAFRAGGERRGPYTTEQFRDRTRERTELIAGVLVANQLAVVGAQTKSLKTLISLDAAISIATGTPWLGYEHWVCGQAQRVGFFSAESGAETLLRKHDVIAASKRHRLVGAERDTFNQALAANLYWDDQVPDLSDAASLDRFRRTITQHQLAVVFVDPLSMAIGAAAKDLANMAVGGQVILRAAHVCREAGCTLVLVHHTSGDRMRQGSDRARGPIELTDIAYPAIGNHARQWITLNRAEAYDEQTRRSVLWLRAGGSGLQAGGTFRVAITEGHRHDQWDVRVETQTQSIEGDQSRRDGEATRQRLDHERRVLECLAQHPDGVAINAMTRSGALPGIGRAALEQLLPALQARGAVRMRPGSGNSRYWFRADPSMRPPAGGVDGSSNAEEGGAPSP